MSIQDTVQQHYKRYGIHVKREKRKAESERLSTVSSRVVVVTTVKRNVYKCKVKTFFEFMHFLGKNTPFLRDARTKILQK